MKFGIQLLALFLATPAVAGTQIISDHVKAVDGDTLDLSGIRMRLDAMDAPESKQVCRRDGVDWLCGQESSAFMRKLVDGRTLTCSVVSHDRYGRVLGTCTLPDGRDVQEASVAAGMATAYRHFSMKLAPAEDKAKADRIGIWASEFEEPYLWRKQHPR